MKIERKKSRSAEVYTASLNDIMFFLLLFFLIISTMVTPATIRVLLPKSKTSESTMIKKVIVITVTGDHRYFVDQKETSFAGIEPELEYILKNKQANEDVSIILEADKSLNLQDVVDILDIGNKLQLKIMLFTQKEK